MPITSPLLGASLTQVFKPPLDGVNPAGSFYDKYAPFAIGTRADTVGVPVAGASGEAVFCRAGGGIAAGATAGITNGVTVAAAGGNTFTNNTGVALVAGDYAWLTAGAATTP